jgi:hypothetical protein
MIIQPDRHRRLMQAIFSALHGTLHQQTPAVLAARDRLRDAVARGPDGGSGLYFYRAWALSRYMSDVEATRDTR